MEIHRLIIDASDCEGNLKAMQKLYTLINKLLAVSGLNKENEISLCRYIDKVDSIANGYGGFVFVEGGHVSVNTFPGLKTASLAITSIREINEDEVTSVFVEYTRCKDYERHECETSEMASPSRSG